MSKSLLKSSYLVGTMTVLSRIVGLAREIIFASFFGASSNMDAFFFAFQIPNFLRRLFAEGAFSQAFVPVVSEYRQRHPQQQVREFIGRMSGLLSISVIIVTIIAIIVSPLIVAIFAPGFLRDHSKFLLTSYMLKITFPYLFFISLTAFAGSILNSYNKFTVPAITPALLNASLIIAAIILAPHFSQPVVGLACGVFIGGIIQLAFQVPFLRNLQLLPLPRLVMNDPGVKKVLKLMVPAVFGVSVAPLGLLIDNIFASFLPNGSISWLYFSNRLVNFPLAVFGIAIATVVLPNLARKHTQGANKDFASTLDWGLRCVLVIGIPSAVGLLMLAKPLIATILEYGKFDVFALTMAAKSLIAFALGLPSFMLLKVLATGFYSRQNIKTPVKIAVVSLGANMLLNFALVYPLAHAGLALATTLSSILNSGLLLITLRRKKIYTPQPGWVKYLSQLLAANLVMAVFLWLFAQSATAWIAWDWKLRIVHLAPLLVGAIITYLGTLYLVGVRWQHFAA